jgi:hypothetical protein
VELGRPGWTRTHEFELGQWDGQAEVYFLVRTPPFEPRPRLSWTQLEAEFATAMCWWTLDEIERSSSAGHGQSRWTSASSTVPAGVALR